MRFVNEMSELAGFRRLAVMLIVIGTLFAVGQFTHLHFLYRLWPLIITMLGIGFVGIFIKRQRREAAYLSVGVYLLCFSALALTCNFMSWGMLAHLWPLFIGFLGLTFVAPYVFGKSHRWALLAGLLLISLCAVFFFVFAIGPQYWWTVLILSGVSILIAERAR